MMIWIFYLLLFSFSTPSSHGFPWRIFIVFPSIGLKSIIVINRSFDAKSCNKLVYFRKLLQMSLNNSSFGETLEVSENLRLIFNSNLKNLKSFCGKKGAFDCAMIRAQVFRLPAQSKVSFFPQKDFKFFKFEFNLHLFAM